MPGDPSVTTPLSAGVKVFVAERGNGYMHDLASMIAEAAAFSRPTRLVTDELPAHDGSINLVVAPHEFFELSNAPAAELQRAASASVCVATEQPGTPWFELTLDACRFGRLALDINDVGVTALRARGVAARRLVLGATASLDHARRRTGPVERRPIDVVFMGGIDDRRGRILAELAPSLYEWDCDLRLFRFDRPVGASTPGVVFGSAKFELLSSARILLNVHRQPAGHASDALPYFEWVRMIDAMANGCAVVSEPSVDHQPLVSGEHFLTASEADLAEAVLSLLHDERRRATLAERAHEVVTSQLDLGRSLAPLLDDIERTVLTPAPPGTTGTGGSGQDHRWGFGAAASAPVRLGPFQPYTSLRARARRLALAELDAVHRLDATQCLLRHGDVQHVTRLSTSAYDSSDPEVSVIVTVYNYADVVTETLASIAASRDVDFEIVVVDDHATDDSRAVIERFLTDHDSVPIVLVAKDANEGLAAARNTGFAEARAPHVMVMDADNHVYPTCLARLRQTLIDDPDASASYAILEDFGDQRNVRSALAWDVRRLCAANYIDAQAMWRKSAWSALGGYRADDEFVYGWEDWDLWLRLADAGGHATLRREILGRYRVRHGSMISLTNMHTADAIDAMRRRYVSLPWPRPVV